MSKPRDEAIVVVDEQRCTGCGYCYLSCPFDAIRLVDSTSRILDACTACWICLRHCPVDALRQGRRPRDG